MYLIYGFVFQSSIYVKQKMRLHILYWKAPLFFVGNSGQATGRGFPQSFRVGSGRSLARKAKHFVLHFDGFLSVLNFRLCFPAYSSQIFNISWSAPIEGARRRESSEYPRIPRYVPRTQQPLLFRLSSEKRLFT